MTGETDARARLRQMQEQAQQVNPALSDAPPGVSVQFPNAQGEQAGSDPRQRLRALQAQIVGAQGAQQDVQQPQAPAAMRQRVEDALARGMTPERQQQQAADPRQRAQIDQMRGDPLGILGGDQPQPQGQRQPQGIMAGVTDRMAQRFADMQASAADGRYQPRPPTREEIAAQAHPNMAISGILGAGQGALFGFADEVAGIGGAIHGAIAPNRTAAEGYTQTRDAVRGYTDAARRDHPIVTGIGDIGGAIVTTAPAVMAAAPLAAGGSGALSVAGRSAALGAGAGAAQGALYGLGSGEDGTRLQSAGQGAAIGGALGGIIGLAAPAASAGVASILRRFRTSDISTIAQQFGISPRAARAVRQALQAEDFTAAQQAIERAGGRAMLADAGPATQSLLDESMTGSTRAARIGGDAVQARAQAGGQEFSRVLDRFFGRPQGVQTARAAIRGETAAARQAAYDAAYAQPIDYSGRAGLRLESLWSRVPAAARQRAARLMQTEGVRSRQAMASIQPDGSVVFSRPADVRQWDYVTRAINDAAQSGEARGAMGGATAESRALSDLSRQIRDTLRGSVPQYNEALRAGADTIRRSQAVEVGASLLRPSMTREQARMAIDGMTAAERTAARQGLRSAIDDLMARTTQALTDPNMDAREAIRAWRALSSRQAQENIATLMGQGRAQGFSREVDRIATDFMLRASVAQNIRTAVRQAVQGEARQASSPNILGFLFSVVRSPHEAARGLVQAMTAEGGGARAARQAGLFDEITQALTQTRGTEEARRIMRVVGESIGSEPISQARADYIARQLVTALGDGVYQTARQSQATQ